MTVTQRVTGALLLLVALFAALELAQLHRIRQIDSQIRGLALVDLEVARGTLRIRRHLAALDEFERKYALLRDPAYAEEIEELYRRVDTELERLFSLELSPGERQALEDFERAFDRHLEDEAVDGNNDFTAQQQALDRLEVTARQRTNERIQLASEHGESAARASSVGMVLGLLAVLLVVVVLERTVSFPIRRLARATRRLARGDFEVRVPASGAAELASLATDFNSMTEQLRELDRLKQDFVSGVSHDLKAPLASIHETLSLLLEEQTSELTTTQREMLELALRSNRRLRGMIEDLLDLARLEAGGVAFDLGRHSLDELVDESVQELEVHLGRQAPPVQRVSAAAGDLEVEVDRALLLQVLRNLLSNAVRHAPGSPVTVRLGGAGDRQELERSFRVPPRGAPVPTVWVEVVDRGPGVPDRDKEAIFAGFRAVSRSRRSGQGTGLGLAIARRIVENHRGCLWVEDADGGGSRFVVALPTAQGDVTDDEMRRAAS